MKKLLSILLVASLLAVSVACMFAVSAAADDAEVNYLAAFVDADNDAYSVKVNANGSVTITIKKDVAEATKIVDFSQDWAFDATKQYYFVADVACDNGDLNFINHYTRKDKADSNTVADLYWNSMNNTESYGDYIARKEGTAAVWNISKYLGSADKYQFADHMHAFVDFTITDAKAGDVITINTLALVTDPKVVTPGTPLVAGDDDKGGNDNNTTSESSTSSEASTSSTPSSTTPPTGDAGLIVFAVLGVLAVVGGAVAVRARH